MSMSPGEAVRLERQKAKRDWYLRKENLFFFARDICGYDKLIEGFHDVICAWLAAHSEDLYVFWSAARGHFKTTLQIADIVQDLLIDPKATHLWVHNTLSQAAKAAEEAAWHFQYNDKIREFWPEHCAPKGKKFYRSPAQDGTASFNLVSRLKDRSAQPSFTACSIEKDVTGMHISGSVRMDDLISADTIKETGGLGKVSDYWSHTVIPVMDPGCKARNTGTRWDAADLYGKWINSKRWQSLVRAVLEDEDGNPDWKGKNVGVISDEELELRREEMGSLFGPQMMNDPAPMHERIWNESECEHPMLSQPQMRQGAGKIILLGDPAPSLIGSPKWTKEKERADLAKDDWAWCVVRVRRNGARQEIILLDGTYATTWDEDDGFDEGARLAKKWGATHAGIESPGGLGGSYARAWKRACARNGIRCALLSLASTNKADSKNYRAASLASRARQMEFSVCESVPSMFLAKFYEQIRPYRKTAPGKNNLKHDDVVDVVSYATDPAVDEIAPQPLAIPTDEEWDDDWQDYSPTFGRYI
jgi:hypothetical protein